MEARGEDQRQQLRLVAQLADGDDGGGNEEGFERGGVGDGLLRPRPESMLCYCHKFPAVPDAAGRERGIIVAFARNLTGSSANQRLFST